MLLARIFHTPERRMGAGGLQSDAAPAVGRVPSRGTLMTIPPKCETSGLERIAALLAGITLIPLQDRKRRSVLEMWQEPVLKQKTPRGWEPDR